MIDLYTQYLLIDKELGLPSGIKGFICFSFLAKLSCFTKKIN